MHGIQCYSDYTKYYPAADAGEREGEGLKWGRGGWDSDALMDHEVGSTSGEPSCSLFQLGHRTGRWQQREGGAGGEGRGAGLHVLSVHFIQQRRGVPGDGHGRALDHGAGRRPRRHPLSLLPPLRLLLLQPLLRHLAPVHR